MKINSIYFSFILFISFGLLSCGDDDNGTPILDTVSETVENLEAIQNAEYAPNMPPVISGEFTKFSFANNSVVTGDNWDLAFRGTTILVNGGVNTGLISEPDRTGNGGAYIQEGTFAEVTSINEASFYQDSTESKAIAEGSGNSWYIYEPTSHLISPIPGRILVVKTHDGKYAKVEIISYYKDRDEGNLDVQQYYTFNFTYQPNDGAVNF